MPLSGVVPSTNTSNLGGGATQKCLSSSAYGHFLCGMCGIPPGALYHAAICKQRNWDKKLFIYMSLLNPSFKELSLKIVGANNKKNIPRSKKSLSSWNSILSLLSSFVQKRLAIAKNCPRSTYSPFQGLFGNMHPRTPRWLVSSEFKYQWGSTTMNEKKIALEFWKLGEVFFKKLCLRVL